MQDKLSLTFAALADPTRREILHHLSGGPASVKELAAPFAMSQPAVSKHLKVLEHAGLITRSRQAQWRPCTVAAAPLQAAHDWLEQYAKFWEQSFDRLEEYLRTLQAKSPATDEGTKGSKEARHGRKPSDPRDK